MQLTSVFPIVTDSLLFEHPSESFRFRFRFSFQKRLALKHRDFEGVHPYRHSTCNAVSTALARYL